MTDDTRREVEDVSIEQEMRSSFLSFAVSVIRARALPDVRDGMKPSQLRILYGMHEEHLGPSTTHTKCAGIVGHTIKYYHPHGDEAIYMTLARMAQDWLARYPLVNGHGNFGSVDGDPPGAMRYTEARLSPYGAAMMTDIEKDTVDWQDNFDQSKREPTVLPSLFPNLLCNGSAGIAVGMATDIPPHNLSEVVDACCLLIDKPKATLDQVMEVVPGPDFPTGALILGTSGIRDAYLTGRGSILMQARATIEPLESGRVAIIVTELPYRVNKAHLVEQIAELVNTKKMQTISALRDETDRTGVRVVIELKRDANPHVVLNQLYRHTRMRTTFPVNAVALVEGAPRTLGLLDMLRHFLDHRRVVVTRRCQFELERARERAHILEGYRIALRNLDAVIELIKKSPDPATARAGLMKRFKLSERQAQAILELMLQRLTNLEQKKIEDEYKAIIKEIARLEDILSDRRKLMRVVRDELAGLKEKLGDERRTRIKPEEVTEFRVEDLIAEEDMVITVTRDGYIKRLPVDTYHAQGRGGKGVIGLTAKEQDQVEHLFIATTHQTILFFTNKGKVYRLRAHEVPVAGRQARGTAIINLIQIESGEVVTATRTVKKFDEGRYLFMATAKGTVKKTRLTEFDTRLKGGLIAIKLAAEDELCWVKLTDGDQHMVMVTEQGMAIRYHESEVRPMGRAAAGVRGIRLRKGDRVVGIELAPDGLDLLVISARGLGKRTPLAEYRVIGRGNLGVKTLNVTARTGPVVDCKVVSADDDVLVITQEGHIIRQKVGEIRETGRVAQGVIIIRLSKQNRVAGLARVVKHEEEEPT
jgi:DNA gyrase subunit A